MKKLKIAGLGLMLGVAVASKIVQKPLPQVKAPVQAPANPTVAPKPVKVIQPKNILWGTGTPILDEDNILWGTGYEDEI